MRVRASDNYGERHGEYDERFDHSDHHRSHRAFTGARLLAGGVDHGDRAGSFFHRPVESKAASSSRVVLAEYADAARRGAGVRRRQRVRGLFLLNMLMLLVVTPGSGGGSGGGGSHNPPPNPGTPTGVSTVFVTASSGSTVSTSAFTLVGDRKSGA